MNQVLICARKVGHRIGDGGCWVCFALFLALFWCCVVVSGNESGGSLYHV